MAKRAAATPAVPGPEVEAASSPSETQQRILAAALELFAERGYAATSTAAIAKKAGVAEKTIFANFATKDRLFEQILTPAALELVLPRAIGGVRKTLAQPWSSLSDFLGAFMQDRFEFVGAQPAKLKLIAQALLLHPELDDLFVRTFREHLAPRFLAVVKRLEEAGELRAVPPMSLARIVVSVTAGYMLARFVLRPGADWDDEAEIATMIDVLVNGLRPR